MELLWNLELGIWSFEELCRRASSRSTRRCFLRGRKLVRDPVLQLPDAESGEEETLCARERSDGGRFSHSVFLDDFPGTATARFRSSRPARFLA